MCLRKNFPRPLPPPCLPPSPFFFLPPTPSVLLPPHSPTAQRSLRGYCCPLPLLFLRLIYVFVFPLFRPLQVSSRSSTQSLSLLRPLFSLDQPPLSPRPHVLLPPLLVIHFWPVTPTPFACLQSLSVFHRPPFALLLSAFHRPLVLSPRLCSPCSFRALLLVLVILLYLR